jgi:hypothetical protein
MGRPLIDLAGQRFGRLVVVRLSHSGPRKRAYFLCRCDCGNEHLARSDALRRDSTRSCGCLQAEEAARGTHGEAGGGRKRLKASVEYRTWSTMIQRCENPRATDYERYGGRGIKICQRWRESFEAFLTDMGRRPADKRSVDRINNDGNYEPGNCRWATPIEQRRNRSDSRHAHV